MYTFYKTRVGALKRDRACLKMYVLKLGLIRQRALKEREGRNRALTVIRNCTETHAMYK